MNELRADTLLTSHQVADFLQVDPSSVKNWVNAGRLICFRTPGGHRRVRVDALIDFLNRYSMPIPSVLSTAMRRRLLVVDDDAAQWRALSRLLKTYADLIDVQYASDGYSALVAIGDFKPQVILLDIQMPDLDGLEMCRRLRAMPDTSHIRIIVNSGDPRPSIAQMALGVGAHVFLPKPLELSDLLAALQVEDRVRFARGG